MDLSTKKLNMFYQLNFLGGGGAVEVVAIQSTNRHVNEIQYVLDEWTSYKGVQLKLNLTAAANLRISVYSKQNDATELIKDFGYLDYSSGDTLLSLGEVKGQIGVKFSFKEYLTYVNPSEGYTSSYDNNKSFATLRVLCVDVATVDDLGNVYFPSSVIIPELICDPITSLRVPDPRRGQSINASTVRGTTNIDISKASELLVFGSNATTATNSMSVTLMDGSISKAILSEGAALSSSMVSIPRPIGVSASIVAATNAAGFAIAIGE